MVEELLPLPSPSRLTDSSAGGTLATDAHRDCAPRDITKTQERTFRCIRQAFSTVTA